MIKFTALFSAVVFTLVFTCGSVSLVKAQKNHVDNYLESIQ